MRIDSLLIENFRRFKRVELEMPDGVTALVGRNGAGKSTMLEAIGWCLFGNEAARTSKDLLKRRGAAPGDDVRVRLAFTFGGHAYDVTRELIGKGESHVATVTVDGTVAVNPGAQSAREASAFVARLFHMDREAFFTSLVARQRELSALTDAKPADRKRVLLSLLRLDPVDAAIAEARQRKRDARAQLEGVRAARRDVEPLRLALDGVRGALATSDAARSAADARIVALVEEVEDVRGRRDSSRKVFAEFQQVGYEMKAASERVLTVSRERARCAAELERARVARTQALALAPQLATIAVVRAEVERLAALRERNAELGRVQHELTQALAERARAEADILTSTAAVAPAGTLQALALRVANERPRLEAALAGATERGAQALAQADERRRLLATVETRDRRVRELGPESPCPTCTRPLHEHHGVLLHDFAAEADAHRAALAAATAAAQGAHAEMASARAALDALLQRERELSAKLHAVAREQARLDGAHRALAEAAARVDRLAAHAKAFEAEPFDPRALALAQGEARRLDGLSAQHAALVALAERDAELGLLVTEADSAEVEARAAEAAAAARRDALGFDSIAHAALEAAADASERRLGEARVARERVWGEHQRRVDEEQRLASDLAHQQELAALAQGLESRVVLLEHLAGDRDLGLLPEFKDHLIGRVRPLLSAHAGRLFRELTDSRYADLEVAADYDLLIHDDGRPFALERFSGGESDLANLCLRLAVSQLVAERAGTEAFAFLALDEVFGSQDEVRKGNILRALKALSGRFRQVLLITHVDDVKDACEHVLRVTANEDGTSAVSVEQ